MIRFLLFITLMMSSLATLSQSYQIQLSPQQTYLLGQLIWQNEGQKKQQHLTAWNRNEDFPSLGLGHFIWYPTEKKGPFVEQFPQLLAHFESHGVQLPPWLADAEVAPWKTREQFYSEFDQPQLTELRQFLATHLNLQVIFIIERLNRALPMILMQSTKAQQAVIESHLNRLTNTPEGLFVLLDYVNFKGEGLSDKEVYQGQGWGLKQVLLTMPKHYDNPLRAFGLAADEVLTRRVKNAPRDEFMWLKGWRARIHGYPKISITTE